MRIVCPLNETVVGTTRQVKKFVIIKTIGRETRILETASWEEEYVAGFDLICNRNRNFWYPIKWVS